MSSSIHKEYTPLMRTRKAPRSEDDVWVNLATPLLQQLWAERDGSSSAAESVHRTIREAILSGILPPGSRLREEDLARRFAVSRTPVREAILRLEGERLAVPAPRRGLVVAAVEREEILEVYVVRSAVDGLASRLAAQSAGQADTSTLTWLNMRLAEAGSAQRWDEMARLNLEFHEAVCRAGHNSVLLELMRMIHDRVRRFPGTTFAIAERAAEAVEEHKQIIDAIMARNADEAEAAARGHMTKAMETRIVMLVHGPDDVNGTRSR